MKNKLIANLLEQRDGEIYGAVRREIERTFDDYSRNWFLMKELSRQGLRFNVDVTESDGAVEVKADIPGVDAKNIEVQLKDNTLIIKGEKRRKKKRRRRNTISAKGLMGRSSVLLLSQLKWMIPRLTQPSQTEPFTSICQSHTPARMAVRPSLSRRLDCHRINRKVASSMAVYR